MACPQRLSQWSQEVSSAFAHLSKAQASGLALWSAGMALTGSGGIIGVALGGGISFLINKLLPELPSAVPLWAVIAAVTASMSVGLFFGIYPAMKASRLDPVEALRYE